MIHNENDSYSERIAKERTPIRVDRAGSRRPRLSAYAGIGFAISWLIGLTVYSVSTTVRSTGAEVIAANAGHQGQAITQYVFTEGIPALAMALVTFALAQLAARSGHRRAAAVVSISGLGAAAVSLVQCALGIHLAGWVISRYPVDNGTASALFDLINRLDGVKMFLLAVLAFAGLVLAHPDRGPLPSWTRYPAAALGVTIAISAIGYLFLLSSPAQAAWISLPFLIFWVVTTGWITSTLRAHDGPRQRTGR